MLMRTDPFRELDRLTQQVLGTTARPAMMLMDAWRDGEHFVVGVRPSRRECRHHRPRRRAQRPHRAGGRVQGREKSDEMLAAERPRGVFSRQLFLGDTLDTEAIEASYDAGVLSLRIPVAEKAKPRKITINQDSSERQAISV
jgi:HSP20 family protein